MAEPRVWSPLFAHERFAFAAGDVRLINIYSTGKAGQSNADEWAAEMAARQCAGIARRLVMVRVLFKRDVGPVPLVDAVPAAVPLLDAVPVARPLVSRLPMRSALGVLTYNEAEVAMALLAAGGALVPLKVMEMTAGRPLGPALAALRARVAEWSRTIEILRRHGGYVLIGRGHELEALFDAATDRLARKIADDRLLEWEDRTAGEILGARA